MQTFKVKLAAGGHLNAWTYMTVPFDVEKTYGSRARVSVRGAINGFAYRSSIFPAGDGTHQMMVNKQMLAGAGAAAGDVVKVEMEPDTAARTVRIPPALRKAFSGNPAARDAFEKLAPSGKKAYVDWIEQAKQAETRQRRLGKTVDLLLAGKKAPT